MNKNIRLELEDQLLDKLKGRLQVLQPDHDREEIASAALESVLANDKARRFDSEFQKPADKVSFVREFLSYGVMA